MIHGDIADQASDLTERELESNLARVRAEAAKPMVPCTGRCHYCDDIVSDDMRYCESSCRDMHQREIDAKKRNGTR